MKGLIIISGVGLAVYVGLIALSGRSSGAFYETQTNSGEGIELFERNGFIYDQKGRMWT